MTTVAHLTSVHRRTDTRIFLRQCRSLVEAGYEVVLVVADGHGDTSVDGVRIQDVGQPSGCFEQHGNFARPSSTFTTRNFSRWAGC